MPHRLLSFTPFIGIACLLAAEIVQTVQHGSDEWERSLLLNGVTYLIGANGLAFGIGHIFFAGVVADSIGWPRDNPFQTEVGLANLSLGVVGSLAGLYERDFWLATIVAAAVFYGGAAIVHVRDMVHSKNFSVGNAGFVFYYDILAPVVLFILYAIHVSRS